MDNNETFRGRLLQGEEGFIIDVVALVRRSRRAERREGRKDGKKDNYETTDTHQTVCPSNNCLCSSLRPHQSLSPSSSFASGVVEDGVQLGVHHPLVVRVSVKPHHPVHLELAAPRVGPPAAVDGRVPSGSSRSPVVHAEGETLVVVGGRGRGLVLERREVPVDAERRAEGRVKRLAVRHQDPVEEGLQRAVGLTFDLVEDVGRLHGAVGRAGQAGRQPGALVRVVSGIGGGAGGGQVDRQVGRLLRQEGSRIQLQAARHQVRGRLRQT